LVAVWGNRLKSDSAHFVYLLRCADDSLYTGYTNDVERRLTTHQAGKGAKYTRSRLPVSLAAVFPFPTRGEALRFENQVKKLPRAKKLALLTK
jgi:putative endonuclease